MVQAHCSCPPGTIGFSGVLQLGWNTGRGPHRSQSDPFEGLLPALVASCGWWVRGLWRLFRSTGVFKLAVICICGVVMSISRSRRNGYIFKFNVSIILNPAGQFFAELCLSHRTFVMICVSSGCTKEGQRFLATSGGNANP